MRIEEVRSVDGGDGGLCSVGAEEEGGWMLMSMLIYVFGEVVCYYD